MPHHGLDEPETRAVHEFGETARRESIKHICGCGTGAIHTWPTQFGLGWPDVDPNMTLADKPIGQKQGETFLAGYGDGEQRAAAERVWQQPADRPVSARLTGNVLLIGTRGPYAEHVDVAGGGAIQTSNSDVW
jgi:hypothetical protein